MRHNNVMSVFNIQFIWDEEKMRKFFRLNLVIYTAGSLVASVYGLFLPASTPYHLLIIFVPLVDVFVSLLNLVFINRRYQGWRFLITNMIIQMNASIFMAITGGFSSYLQYASYALLIITLVQLGPTAASILGSWSVVTFLGILAWMLKSGNDYSVILSFFVYTAPYILFVIIGRNMGIELSLQFEARQKLEQIDDLKNQFITLSSHYLRTPLTEIKGFASYLKGTPLTQEQSQKLSGIGRSIQQLDLAVEEMLSISEIEKGRQKITPFPADMDNLVRRVVDGFIPEAVSKGINLTYQGPQVNSGSSNFDLIKMQIVISSLIDNALKFTQPQGSVTVTLSAIDGNYLIKVTDTGIGMTPEQQKNLFESFSKGGINQAMSMSHPGVGLSLYLCKLIIDAHGGKIEVSSVKDHGTTFAITLPIT